VPTDRRRAFGQVAELYDQARPSYPAALVDAVLAFAKAGRGDRALEVGAGTGKATTLFATRGLRIVALEPSSAMAQLARRNCARYEQVLVVEQDFEQWRGDDQAFKLVFSAQAWHWIAPDVRYARARAALQPGGALAVFWNRPNWESCGFRDQLAAVYQREAPDLGADLGPGPMHPAAQTTPTWWSDWGGQLRTAAGFVEAQARSYSWLQPYTTEDYLRLLQTHSDHVVLEPERLASLLAGVAAVLERQGGSFALEHVTVLWMARTAG
jgi:SAM-dependent methyltransferase